MSSRENIVKSLMLLVLATSTSAFPQERLLVSPNNEVIPLERSQSAVSAAKSRGFQVLNPSNCSSGFIFGYPDFWFPPNSNFGAYHKDVLGEWFIAPAGGTIDTIFWDQLGSVGALDSLVSVRIFRSNIYPGRGPGYPPYPLPCIAWGYYNDTNDADQHITPFKDEATDTTWVSKMPYGGKTFDPLGEELWRSGGYKVHVHASSVIMLPLSETGQKITVKKGDAFFITMRMNSINGHDSLLARTEFAASFFNITSPDANYPSHLWKFYEHDMGPSNCYNLGDLLYKGWYARGGITGDTLNVGAYNIWYSMTVSPSTPSTVDTIATVTTTDSTRICFTLASCATSSPPLDVWIVYSFNSNPSDSILLDQTDPTTFCGKIPPIPPNSIFCSHLSIYRWDGTISSAQTACLRTVIANFENPSIAKPYVFALEQNYPNPFNPTTNVSFVIGNLSLVTLQVFDVLGRVVATLVNENRFPGYYHVVWDASNVPNGVYFYRLQTEKGLEVKKMVVMK